MKLRQMAVGGLLMVASLGTVVCAKGQVASSDEQTAEELLKAGKFANAKKSYGRVVAVTYDRARVLEDVRGNV